MVFSFRKIVCVVGLRMHYFEDALQCMSFFIGIEQAGEDFSETAERQRKRADHVSGLARGRDALK